MAGLQRKLAQVGLKDPAVENLSSFIGVDGTNTTLFSNQQTAVNLRTQQMTASVNLIKALGGGWNASQVPSPSQMISQAPPSP